MNINKANTISHNTLIILWIYGNLKAWLSSTRFCFHRCLFLGTLYNHRTPKLLISLCLRRLFFRNAAVVCKSLKSLCGGYLRRLFFRSAAVVCKSLKSFVRRFCGGSARCDKTTSNPLKSLCGGSFPRVRARVISLPRGRDIYMKITAAFLSRATAPLPFAFELTRGLLTRARENPTINFVTSARGLI